MTYVTNKHNLPEALARFARSDRYTKGAAKYSATELISPPRLALLKKTRRADLSVDVSDMMFQILGTAVHHVLETGAKPDEIAEERLYTTIMGTTISGAMDLQYDKAGRYIDITDYKVTSAYSVMQEKPEYEQQLNVYAYMVEREKRIVVRNLTICAVVRDWRMYEFKTRVNYPERPVVMVPVRVWPQAEREAFLKERIALHTEAEMHVDLGEDLPHCTDEETWLRDEAWATYKPNGKRAKAVFQTQSQAIAYAEANGLTVTHRPGRRVRCEDHCPVSSFCTQWAAYREEEDHAQEGEDQAQA